MNDRDVAIIGMAGVFPKAANLRQYWSNLANGVNAITDLPPKRWREHSNFRLPPGHEAHIPGARGGFLPDEVFFDPVKYGVLPNLVKHGDPDQFLMLAVIDDALRDAKVAMDDPVRERTDVIIGRGGYATGKLVEMTLKAELYDAFLEILDRKYPEFTRGAKRAELETYLRSTLTPKDVDNVSTAVSNITASRTANRLNLRGASFTVDGACASSLLATEDAVWRLRNGQSDLAVAAGLFLSKTPTFLYVFTQLGALSPSQTIRPFDRRADGLLAGEGAGAVVLKRLRDAVRDGDSIYAIIRGVGSASDGRVVDVLAPSSSGQLLALERAYTDAGVDRDSISMLEVHGTATLAGDETELDTVKKFFGTVSSPATARAMGSVKSMIGHAMPAAGIASLIKVALSLSNKILPPSLNCEQPREDLIDAPFYVNTTTRPWVQSAAMGPRRAGVNAFGFGGINAHIVLEEARPLAPKRLVQGATFEPPAEESKVIPRPIEPGVRRETELFAFSADSAAELIAQVHQTKTFLEKDRSGAEIADVAFSLSRKIDLSKKAKLAIIAADAENFHRLADLCVSQLSTEKPDFEDVEEVYYSSDAAKPPGRVAFVFPGMGFPGMIGNYPDHILELCLHYPELRAEFDFFEDRDRNPEDAIPTSSIFCPPASLPEEYRKKLKSRLAPPKVDDKVDGPTPAHERYLAAMGVTLSNWIGWVLLSKFKIPVDLMTGQSQGEMAALCAAGVSDFHATAPAYWKVLNVDTRDKTGSRLAFAWSTAEDLQPLLDKHPGTYLAIYMAPVGVIFAGHREGLEAIAEELRQKQVLVQILPYPPIHSPCLAHLRKELVDSLAGENFKIQPAKIDMYSSITADLYPTDEQGIRDTLMKNVDEPLRIWQTVRRMYADGARVFVQVGGGHMAAHLEILLEEGATASTAALDVDVRNPLTQINHLCATLFSVGVSIDFGALYEYRRCREIDVASPQGSPAHGRMAVPLRIDWTPLYSENIPARGAALDPIVATAAAQAAPTMNGDHTAAEPEGEAEVFVDEAAGAAAVLDPEFASRLPIMGRITRFAAEQEVVVERGLDIDEDLFLADHLFVHAHCKPLREKLPVLPLTMSLEFAAEAASLLAPGLGVIGFENVKGLRWIGLRDEDRTDLRIEAKLLSIDESTGVRRFQATLIYKDKPGFQAVVLCGPEYRRDTEFAVVDSSGEGPWPFAVEQVYTERLMFHGPSFHCVAGLTTFGNPGSSGELLVRRKDQLFASKPDPFLWTDPCLMDCIGQIVGLWTMAFDQFILPTSAEKIEFCSPTPPVGTIAPIWIEVMEFNLDTKQIRCNVEIGDGQGGTWVRVQGWAEWIMKWPKQYADTTRLPERYLIGEELSVAGLPADAVCMLMPKSSLKGVDLDWASRIFLHTGEMPEYNAIDNDKKRRQHVMSRIAVKEAVRVWWARQHGTMYPHPAEFMTAKTDAGAPYLLPAGDPSMPHISLAHTEEFAVAAAGGAPVGVDLEVIGPNAREIVGHFVADEERALLEHLTTQQPDDAWETRLWSAKEAVGKLLGTGLGGRPKDFVMIDADWDGCLLVLHEPTGERFAVRTTRLDSMILATTTHPRIEAGCFADRHAVAAPF